MQKPAENRTVVLEGFENTVTKEMIYNYFKKAGVKFITINAKKLNAYVEFETEKLAKEAVENYYGKPLLKKPLILAFKSDKAGTPTEFHITGLDTPNADLNSIHKITSKYGKSCKLRFNVSNSYKVSNNGYLSYLNISPAEVENLTKDLELLGIKISTYDKDKSKKVTVKIENFVEPFKKDKDTLTQQITLNEKKLKQIISDLIKIGDKEYKIAIIARPNLEDLNELSAWVTFEDQDKAIKFFEQAKATKAQHFTANTVLGIKVTDEAESMSNLFSIGLIKSDDKMTDDAFGESFLKALRDECKFGGIVNVTVKPMRKKVEDKTASAVASPIVYLAFVTMVNEDSGRELLAVYLKDNNKKVLKRFYKGDPFFNIFISSNFKKEITRAKQGFKRMEKDIKNFGDQMVKEQIEIKGMNRPGRPYQYPNLPVGVGAPMGMGGHPMNPMGMMGPMSMLPRPGMPGMNPMAMNFPQMGQQMLDRNELIRDKNNYLDKDISMMRRFIFPILKTDIQEIIKDVNQSVYLANKIVSDSDVKTLFTYIESKEELKKKIQSIPPVQNPNQPQN